MFITRFITCADVQRANGFLFSAISIMLIPRAHTSLFKHAPPSYISGPIYDDVPHNVFRFEHECSSCTANPKSPNLIKPLSEMNRLSGLMSYTSIIHLNSHSVNDVLIVKIRQPQQTTTHHLPQFLLLQSIPTPQIRSHRPTVAVLHHNLHITHSSNNTPTTRLLFATHRSIARCNETDTPSTTSTHSRSDRPPSPSSLA